MEIERRRPRRSRLASGSGQYAQPPIIDAITPNGDELAQIVHDLKNPLAAIALEAELLQTCGAQCGSFDAQRSLVRIRHNVQFLDRMIFDLIDACTLSNGEFALSCVPCDLVDLVASVVRRVVPHSERDRVVVEASEPINVLADELRIERVVMNLLDNALEYTTSAGGIVVRMSKDDSAARLSISDVGSGLSAAEVNIVFEPYRSVSSTAGRVGTGLGLYVSKQIVEAHGGSIGVESVRGVGTRFFFALPLRRSS